VVAPIVRTFRFSTSSGYGHPSLSFESDSLSCSVFPGALWCSYNHASRVATCPSSVGELAMFGPFNSSCALLLWVTSNFILSIASSKLTLFFHNLAPISSNSQSLILPCQMASHNCRIPLCRPSCSGQTIGVMAHSVMDRVPLAYPALCTVIPTQQTLVMHRFSWVDGRKTYNRTLRMTTLLQRGFSAHPPICTWSRLLHLSVLCAQLLGVYGASSDAPCCFWAMIMVSRLMNCTSLVAPLSADHCLTSVVMCHNDLIIIL